MKIQLEEKTGVLRFASSVDLYPIFVDVVENLMLGCFTHSYHNCRYLQMENSLAEVFAK